MPLLYIQNKYLAATRDWLMRARPTWLRGSATDQEREALQILSEEIERELRGHLYVRWQQEQEAACGKKKPARKRNKKTK